MDARVSLEQSIVPGAELLLRLTEYDIDNASTYVRHSQDDSERVKAAKLAIYTRRQDRTKKRIRSWALDPEPVARELEVENSFVEDSPVDYLMFGEDPQFAHDVS